MVFISVLTMCTSQNCPMRDKCYRVQAKVDDYQDWNNFEYTCNENSGFENFISVISVKHFDES